jgi:RimJ/RimL family protein N-acetyltransferase
MLAHLRSVVVLAVLPSGICCLARLTAMPDTALIEAEFNSMSNIQTDRLMLRRWRDSDREPFARINADPRVMEFFPAALTRDETDILVDRIEAHFVEHGFGLWAVELRSDCEFIGFIGLNVPRFQAHFSPCVEIGWRLAPGHWGRGLATEGARAVLHQAFIELKLPEIVSFTTFANLRSRRVMEKLGMTHNPTDDFDHPYLSEDHPLRRHVLYRKAANREQLGARS